MKKNKDGGGENREKKKRKKTKQEKLRSKITEKEIRQNRK